MCLQLAVKIDFCEQIRIDDGTQGSEVDRKERIGECESSAAVTNYLNLYGFQSTIFHKACNLSIELDDKRYV